MRVVALPAIMIAAAGFHSSVEPLPKPLKSTLKARGFWQKGCPVPLSGLRLLTVTHRDFQGRRQLGRLVVHRTAAKPLRRAFRKVYFLNFSIRHMRLRDMYGPPSQRPNDVTGSFSCRKAVPSPCNPGRVTSWSNHAYGFAVDINPRENPYVGCGMSRDPTAQRYRKRTPHRPGMVTPKVVAAFASVGWEWGGSWAGDTKDYMHFSVNGH